MELAKPRPDTRSFFVILDKEGIDRHNIIKVLIKDKIAAIINPFTINDAKKMVCSAYHEWKPGTDTFIIDCHRGIKLKMVLLLMSIHGKCANVPVET